jgi:signal transduction histidine kinase
MISPMPPPARSRLTIRTVLVLGFGLTLGLWLFSGYYFTTRVAELQRQSALVTDRYVRAQARMSAVRSQVLLASVYVRDALLDPNPESIVDYRIKIDEAFRISGRALVEYEPVLDTASESARVTQLRVTIDEFHASVLDVLDGDSTRWPSDALMLLRDRIMPRREAAIQVSEDVQALNRGAYIDQQTAMTAIYRGTQQRIWTQFGLAVIASFVIGLAAIGRVAALERELRQQQEQDARNSADLQRLSSQLITAQEEERRRIARELHDEVGQALSAIKMELALAERNLQQPWRVDATLGTARTMTENTLQTVRDLSRLLHPAVLDDIGLSAAIETYVREFRKRYSVPVEFAQEQLDVRLPPDCEVAVYRVVQEALTNVARHARAKSCRVVLRHVGAAVEISVEDDGVGFDPEAQRRGTVVQGLGLLGMRERVTRIGGQCVVDSAVGHGTKVTVTLASGNASDEHAAPQAGAASRVLVDA